MMDIIDLLVKWSDIKIIETSICKYCNVKFPITDLEINLLDKHWFKYPEHCSLCNFKLLNSLLNDKHLYHRKDTRNSNNIISIHSDGYLWDVYEVKDYKKLILDDIALDYWVDISDDIYWDFLKLYNIFPRPSRLIYPSLENWEYSSHAWWAKNIYLSYAVFIDCEDIYYSFRVVWLCKNIFNSFTIWTSSNVLSSREILDSHNIFYSNNVLNSSNILFCESIENSKECIFSCNQINSKYKIFNKQYSKDEYLKIKADIYLRINKKNEFNFLLEKYFEFLENNLIIETSKLNKSEKVSWDTIYSSYNCINWFSVIWTRDSVNVSAIWTDANDSMKNIINSIEAWNNCENSVSSWSFWWNLYNIFYSFSIIENSKNIHYSIDIDSCEECIFCIWLKSKKYCILNKQYSKEDYFIKKQEIIQKLKSENKWWDPLPFVLTWFPYNDTLAYDYFSINKLIKSNLEEIIINNKSTWVVKLFNDNFLADWELDLGWKEKIQIKWRTKNKEINIPENSKTIKSEDLPSILDTNDDILKKVIICEETKRPYRIIKQELDFLKSKNLPLPSIHNELRIDKLVTSRPFWQLFIWTCDKCNSKVLSVYKERPKFKLYCNLCYKNFMYK